jgi:REP element-mobilizing transposase RayT
VKRRYRRHLPHVIPENTPIFVTWSLKGAIPNEVRERLKLERLRLESQPRRPGESTFQRRLREEKQMLVMADRHLDTASTGPVHLKDPIAAEIVEATLLRDAFERCYLFAWCVMANHVHALMTPRIEWKTLMQGINGTSSRRINELHCATGRTLWQDESYDHAVRDEESFFRIIAYIENYPVAAGMCRFAAVWPWSSARFRDRWPLGRPFLSTTG